MCNSICGKIYTRLYLGKIVSLANSFVSYEKDELTCYFVKEPRDFPEDLLQTIMNIAQDTSLLKNTVNEHQFFVPIPAAQYSPYPS